MVVEGEAVFRVPRKEDYVVLKVFGHRERRRDLYKHKNIAKWLFDKMTSPMGERVDTSGVARRLGKSCVISTRDIRCKIPYICEIEFDKYGAKNIRTPDEHLFHAPSWSSPKNKGKSKIVDKLRTIVISDDAGRALAKHLFGNDTNEKTVKLQIKDLKKGRFSVIPPK